MPRCNHKNAIARDGHANKRCFACNSGTFVVTGSIDLTLSCKDTTTVTPDWVPGQIYSQRVVACGPVDVAFQPALVVG
jgi:hypothetical protein